MAATKRPSVLLPDVASPGADRGRIEHLPHVLRRLRIRDLETLDWLGRYRSFARTAEEASITQPALSKWLRELEDTLALPLFERTSRRVAPTAYGEAMLECVARILTDLRTVQPAFDALKRGTSLPLKIGMLPYIATRLLPGAIEYLATHAPAQQINYSENTLDYLLPLMQRRELDMVVCRLEPAVLTAGFTITELYSDEILVVAPKDHPLHRHSRVTWRDAAAWPWIMPSMGSPMRTALEVEFATAGVAAPHVLMESTSHLTNCAVARRVSCLFVSTRLRRGETDLNGELRQLPLKVSTAVQRIGALTAQPHSSAVSEVLAALQVASQELAPAEEK
ncbi:MAG TPA: LysR substrate-binding domain-containing protein [Paraburkholderia sp.]|uniref:LysR substrate-binding domain-containing protein n=1 Tax=Paraburkholderia sp. TaxID=1926495 RepID=UPI002B45D403|nr:LysR substrate-binding domain-containing protein [Paraburkholderia sp.]HKR41478.1 LysR substrate-binding domain-containing protein [Paraburkholderia sp.]